MGTDNIGYIYCVAGVYLSKSVAITNYAGDIVYIGSSLNFIRHSKGMHVSGSKYQLPVVVDKCNFMKNRSKALESYTVVMIIVSIIVMIYCFFFYLDYTVTYKYTIDNGFSNADILYPKVKREAEINYLLLLSKVIIGYSMFVILGLIWWLFGKKDKN